MKRKESITFKVNDKELEYAEKLASKFEVSLSEAMRILLFDSRFLYSEDVDLVDINIPADDVIREKDSSTTVNDSRERVRNST